MARASVDARRQVQGAARAAVIVAFGVLLVDAVLPATGSALTREQAARIALAALRPPRLEGPVVVYGLPRVLGGSEQVLEEGVPARRGASGRARSLKPPGRQWLFFEDFAPGAYFDHPGRLVFVDERGRVSARIATRSYPVVGGRAPFIGPGVPRRYIVFSQPATTTSPAASRVAPPRALRGQANAHAPAALAGACVLTVFDRGPDGDSLAPDLEAVTVGAAELGVPVYELPVRAHGAPPDGRDLPRFAALLAARHGCTNILIFLAGQGVKGHGVELAWQGAANARRFVTPLNLRETVQRNPHTAFMIIVDASFSGQFVPFLPASLANLLVVSVSSSAAQLSYDGAVTTIRTGSTVAHNPHPSAGGPSGFVANFVAGWRSFASSATDVAAAQAAGGPLFAQLIAQGPALGGGLDWPASIGAATPMTLAPNLPERTPATPTPTQPPSNTAPPVITGTTMQGDELTSTPGSWARSPTSYAYQWQDCRGTSGGCANIAGATSSTYTPAAGDVGHTLDLVVTATNAGGMASASAARSTAVRASVAPPLDGLSASGDELVDGNGDVVQLHGANRSGTEYECIQNNGIFDGPNDAPSVAAMASWQINIVRVPLNEDCWLGVNTTGINPAYTGRNYIAAIVNYVALLHQYGMYAELSLIWGAPGSAQATYQPNAPDEDHSPAMWASMAATFKGDPNVILAPWGETTVGWNCLLNGCNDEATYGSNQDGGAGCGPGCWFYNSAGMQQAVSDMRAAGYDGPIAVPCIGYANDCSDGTGSWQQYVPTDPDHQLIAEAHVYGGNTCDTTACFDSTMLPILQAGYPMIWGETGETYDYSDCPSSSYIQTFLTWAEQNDVGTEAWTWDTWGACSTGALISNYSGTPEDAWATKVETNYQTTFPANP